jgi:hypothetical protein
MVQPIRKASMVKRPLRMRLKGREEIAGSGPLGFRTGVAFFTGFALLCVAVGARIRPANSCRRRFSTPGVSRLRICHSSQEISTVVCFLNPI